MPHLYRLGFLTGEGNWCTGFCAKLTNYSYRSSNEENIVPEVDEELMAEAVEASRRAFTRNQGRASRRMLGHQVGHKSTGFRPDPETYRLMLAGVGLNQRAGESRPRADNWSRRGVRSGAASPSSGGGSEGGSQSGSWETTNSGSSNRARAIDG